MNAQTIELRQAAESDLSAVNRVVEAAFMTWDLPERVKRLSLSSYLYDTFDMQHQRFTVAIAAGQIVGVAAVEEAATQDCPAGGSGLLLHGLYVHPDWMRRGIGSRLLTAVRVAAGEQGYAGVLVKAQSQASGFFRSQGLQALPVEDRARHYAQRFWVDA